jgi:hypothetical protein
MILGLRARVRGAKPTDVPVEQPTTAAPDFMGISWV